MWQQFRDVSLSSFAKLYDRLGVHFDNYNGESFYSDRIPSVVDQLEAKGLLEDSDGAKIVNLDEYGLTPCIILKSDGTTIYASRDIAAVYYRDETWNFYKNIYVVGLPQKNHFEQVFAVLDKADFPKAKDCIHVGFGQVRFADGHFSTREGNVILLEDLLDESVAKTDSIIRGNNPDLSPEDVADIAEKVGLAAVVWTYLRNGRERDIFFSWDEMLDFEGDTAPYLLYTYARIRSVLRKAAASGLPDMTILPPCTDATTIARCLETWQVDPEHLTENDEFMLLRQIDSFGGAVRSAAALYEPSVLARHLLLTSRIFNRYYHQVSVLRADDENVKRARLLLLALIGRMLATGFALLGISPVERM